MNTVLRYTNEQHLLVFCLVLLVGFGCTIWFYAGQARDDRSKLANALNACINLRYDKLHLETELFAAKQQILRLVATSKDVTAKAEKLIDTVQGSLLLDEKTESVFVSDMPGVDVDEPIDVAEVYDRDYKGWVNGDITLKSKIKDRRDHLSLVKLETND